MLKNKTKNETTQTAKPPIERDIFKMTADEIEQLFAWYAFTDDIGNNLVNCQNFKNLVARATNR